MYDVMLLFDGLSVKSCNLERFGAPRHSILYVTGISGAWKSTLASELSLKTGAALIHLDWYYGGHVPVRNEFTEFLESNGVSFSKLYKENKLNFSESDKIFPLLLRYAEDRLLIVEGVQLFDDTIMEDTVQFLKGEPIVSIAVNSKEAAKRVTERDGSCESRGSFKRSIKILRKFERELNMT